MGWWNLWPADYPANEHAVVKIKSAGNTLGDRLLTWPVVDRSCSAETTERTWPFVLVVGQFGVFIASILRLVWVPSGTVLNRPIETGLELGSTITLRLLVSSQYQDLVLQLRQYRLLCSILDTVEDP